jgi:hypothetical protein
LFFSDKKIFTVEQAYNPQNNRLWGKKLSSFKSHQRYVHRVQKPGSVMVWGGVCASGKTPLHFVQPQAKINDQLLSRVC